MFTAYFLILQTSFHRIFCALAVIPHEQAVKLYCKFVVLEYIVSLFPWIFDCGFFSMSLKGWDENIPNISREEELNASLSTGHWGQKSEHLMALMGSSSDLFQSNKGESMSNILSSGVEGSSGSSRPLLPSRSLLSTSIVSIVVSESGPGLAGSTFKNNNRATHEKKIQNCNNPEKTWLWILMQDSPPLKSTSPKQSLGTFEAHRLWQLNLQSGTREISSHCRWLNVCSCG